MCDPMIALTLFSGVLDYKSQNDQAQAQMDAAAESEMLTREQVREQQEQINQQNSLEKSERIKAGMAERAEIATIAGESGALGFSSDRLLYDSYTNESIDIGSMETNRVNSLKQTSASLKQAGLRTSNANRAAEGSAGNLIGTGLQIGVDNADSINRVIKKTFAKR